MKIAYVLHQFLPFYNAGTEQYVYHLAKNLAGRGEEVRIFCFEPNFERGRPFTGISEDVFDDLTVTRISGYMGFYPNYVLAQYYNPFFGQLFGEFLEEEGIELVHYFQNSYVSVALIEQAFVHGIPQVANLMDFWYLCPNIQLRKTSGELCDGPVSCKACIDCLAPLDSNYQALIPYLYGEQSINLPEGVYENASIDFLASSDPYHRVAAMAVRPHFIRRVLELTDWIISPSAFMKSVFVENGYDPKRIRLARYGIARDRLDGIQKSESAHLRIGYIGTVSRHKGLDILIKAFRELDGEDVSLEVHGDLKGFPAFSKRVQKLSEGEDRIRFHGRFESPELPDVLSSIDVLVVPSVWYENTPFVMLEAIASGTPVLASDLGGLAELVEDGKNGMLFEAGNAEDLREKLEALQNDREVLTRMRPDPSSVRSLDENVDEFLEMYGRLARGG
jgi:glycosyltransferase involved in cell wall biosynthesis